MDFFEALPEYDTALYANKKSKTDEDSSLELLKAYLPVLEKLEPWDHDGLYNSMVEYAAAHEMKNAKLMWPVRIATAGKAVTPGRRSGNLPDPRKRGNAAPDSRGH